MSIRRPRFQEENSTESINISPLIDVIFILLIFFIVTMVFADGSAMKIEVPKADAVESVENKPVTIAIYSDGTLSMDGQKMGMSSLEGELRRRLSAKRNAVVLRGDSSASVSALVAVMDCAKACGAKEIYVSADKK